MSTVHNFTATTLVVNTASKCDFTPQYEGLQALYRKNCAQGFAVLGFPCTAEIARFCLQTYNVTFPKFGKNDVNGPELIRFTAFSRAKPREL